VPVWLPVQASKALEVLPMLGLLRVLQQPRLNAIA
jgi:hypothetical protein